MKILLFKVGALGDLLMATPLARQLRRAFPDARIDVLTGQSFVRIFSGNPNVNAVVGFAEGIFFRRDLAGFGRLVRSVRASRYDTVFVLDRHWVFPLAAFLFGVGRRIGFDRMGREGILLTDKVRFEEVRHEVQYYLDLLEFVARPDRADVRMDFFTTSEEDAFADRFWSEHGLDGKSVVCVAPGGGANPGQDLPLKRWPTGHYVELIRRIRQRGLEALLIGGAVDRGIADRIVSEVPVLSAVGAPLGGSAALFRKARAVVASDGGPMHLAASVNGRVVSIFGPTDPRRLAPLGGGRYFWKPGPSGPCYDIYGRISGPAGERECIARVMPEDVADAVARLASGREGGAAT